MPGTDLKRPADLQALLATRFKNQHKEWLSGGGSWPLSVGLSPPTEAEAMERLAEARMWAEEWAAWRGPAEVKFETRSWGRIGKHKVPVSVAFAAAHDVAALVGHGMRWTRATQRYEEARGKWPAIGPGLVRCFSDLADYSDTDWQRLIGVLDWLSQNRGSGLYPRQLPIRGIDSKWIENRIGIIKTLLSYVANGFEGDLYSGWGLRKLPATSRIAALDPALRAVVGGLKDVAVPNDELRTLQWRPKHVLIVENHQTGLALPDLTGAVAILGLGYVLDVLPRLPWLAGAKLLYWGDIDTHGFAILAQARRHLPELTSILMDPTTTEDHKDLIVLEDDGKGTPERANLTSAELECFDGLVQARWGKGARLEQERIEWGYAMTRLSAALRQDT